MTFGLSAFIRRRLCEHVFGHDWTPVNEFIDSEVLSGRAVPKPVWCCERCGKIEPRRDSDDGPPD